MSSARGKDVVVALSLLAATAYGGWLLARQRLDLAGGWSDGAGAPASLARDGLRYAVWGAPRPLGGEALGEGRESRPALSPDGRLLVFVRGERGLNADLWAAELVGGMPRDPRPLASLNSGADELAPAFGSDALYFASDRGGPEHGLDLWRAPYAEGTLGAPAPLAALATDADDTDPCPVPGTDELLFASNRPRSARTDFDLFRATPRAGGGYSVAALDAACSPFDEREPALTADGRALFFASDRAGGSAGAFTLWRCFAGAEGWLAPTPVAGPEGPLIGRAPLPSADGFSLLLERPGDGEEGAGLLRARSRELFRIPGPPVGWRELLTLALLLTTALLAFLAKHWHGLEIVYKCFLVSLLVHLLLMLWFREVHPEPKEATLHGADRVFHVHLAPDEGGTPAALRERDGELTRARPEAPEPEARLARADAPAPSTAPASPAADRTLASPEPPALATAAPARAVAELSPAAPPAAAAEVALEEREPDAPRLGARAPALALAAPSAAPAPDAAAPAEPALASSSPSASEARAEAPAQGAPALAALAAEAPAEETPTPRGAATPPATRASQSASLALRAPARESAAPALDARAPSLALAAPSRAPAPPPDAPDAPARAAGAAELPAASAARPDAAATPAGALAAAAPALAAPAPRTALAAPREVASPAADVALRAPQEPPPTAAPAADTTPFDATAAPARLALAREPAGSDAGPALRARPDPPPKASPAPQHAAPALPLEARDEVPPAAREALAGPPAAAPALPELALRAPPVPEPAPARAAEASAPRFDPLADAPPLTAPAPARASDAAPTPPRLVAADEPPVPRPAPPVLEAPAPPPPSAPERPDERLARTPYESRFGAEKLRALEEHGGSAETERAVARGLAYLARIQHADGSWGDRGDFDRDKYGDVRVGKSALALLAFLGTGELPGGKSEHARTVERAVRFLLSTQDEESGHFGESAAYSHGIATYALAECYALTHDERLAEPLRRAVGHVLASQRSSRDPRIDGGWGYYFAGRPVWDQDPWPRVSVTVWQVMALESARLGGIDVPDDAFEGALRFVRNAWDARRGAFRYDHDPSRLSSAYPVLPASTPAALFALSLLGVDVGAPELAPARAFVTRRAPAGYAYRGDDAFVRDAAGNLYFWYYGTLAMLRAGGTDWERWNAALKATLLPAQAEDGSWEPISIYARYAGDDDDERTYTTALTVLTLEVYYRYYLPLLKVAPR